MTWTSREDPLLDGNWSAVAFGTVGENGTTITSSDGETWVEPGPTRDLDGTAAGAGRFVIVGDSLGGQDGSLFVFSDGIDWLSTPPNPNPGKNLRGIACADGLFVVAGNDVRSLSPPKERAGSCAARA
ncbi:MAG TPA: hypothetical protein VNO52_16595 [Methylomirabilota bacterium]|nr:hypothetical protein [Methylomirabilota bacterium]